MGTFARIAIAAVCVLAVVLPLACSSEDDGTQGTDSAGPETQEQLARLAVAALRAGSLEPFEAALMTKRDVEAVLESLRREDGEEQYRKQRDSMEESGGLEQFAERARTRCRESLDGLRNNLPGRLRGTDWSKAEFDGMNDDETSLQVRGGVEGGDIHFWVKLGERRHGFVLATCMKLARGWICGKGLRVKPTMDDVHPGRDD